MAEWPDPKRQGRIWRRLNSNKKRSQTKRSPERMVDGSMPTPPMIRFTSSSVSRGRDCLYCEQASALPFSLTSAPAGECRPPPFLLKQCRGERLQTRKPTYRYSYHTYRPIAVRGRRVSSVHFCYARIFVKLPASMPKRINAPIVLLFRRVNASMSKKI